MYFSLNKKIFYTVFVLLIFMAILFLTIFLNIYGKKYQEDQNSILLRNQYVMELLYENIALRREVADSKLKLSEESREALSGDLGQKQEELSREQNLNKELQKTYNERTVAFVEGVKIISISSTLSLISIIILGWLLQKWVIAPTRKLTEASKFVAKGDFSHRIKLEKKQIFFDEFERLSNTLNTMIDNIENNITEIKNKEVFLQSLIDAIPDGIRVIDHNYNVVLANKAYMKQFRMLKVENCRKCYQAYNFDKPCPSGMFTCPVQEIKSSTSRGVNFIQNISSRPLSINAAPLKIQNSTDENDFYIIESIRDLSDDIRFSHEQKIASLGFLATSVAHEMKNNLGSIRMILEGLLDNYYKDVADDSEEKKYLQMIYNQVVGSVEMPERLLKLARNNGNEHSCFDTADSINEVLSLLDYEAKRNGVVISQQNAGGFNAVTGNEADFKMIILNLAQNALKAMPSGGKLSVRTSKNQNNVMVEVSDTGVGISPEKLCHIFEPFYSDGRSSRHQGTGLGLAIVKSLVEKFQGTISVDSKLHQGTTFTIKFPKTKRNKLQN